MSIKKYFKFDEPNQFLENEADINYFALNQARRVAVGNMLGDFDENGFYVVDEKIIKQLIAMPKIIVDSLEDVDLIRSAVKFDNYLHFMLTINENKASLILLEKINFESNAKYNAGSYTNMNEYVLEEITIPDRDVDKNAIYTKFNIMRADQGKYYDINDFTEEEQQNFNAIINKIKYNILAQNIMLKQENAIETIEADYFDNVLATIKPYAKIYAEFEKLLTNIILEKQEFLLIGKPFFQKTINEILDNCLRMLLTKLPPEIREELEKKIREIKDKFYKEYNKIIHFRFIASQAKQEVNKDNMISQSVGEIAHPTQLLKVKVDEEKLNNSLSNVLDENEGLKQQLVKKNSDGKAITEDNPVLTKFFKDIKKESGVDMLASETVKKEEVKEEKKVSAPASSSSGGSKIDPVKHQINPVKVEIKPSKQTQISSQKSEVREEYSSKLISSVANNTNVKTAKTNNVASASAEVGSSSNNTSVDKTSDDVNSLEFFS